MLCLSRAKSHTMDSFGRIDHEWEPDLAEVPGKMRNRGVHFLAFAACVLFGLGSVFYSIAGRTLLAGMSLMMALFSLFLIILFEGLDE